MVKGVNGGEKRLVSGWGTHATTYRWCAKELHTWNLCSFISQCRPNKFNDLKKRICDMNNPKELIVLKPLPLSDFFPLFLTFPISCLRTWTCNILQASRAQTELPVSAPTCLSTPSHHTPGRASRPGGCSAKLNEAAATPQPFLSCGSLFSLSADPAASSPEPYLPVSIAFLLAQQPLLFPLPGPCSGLRADLPASALLFLF